MLLESGKYQLKQGSQTVFKGGAAEWRSALGRILLPYLWLWGPAGGHRGQPLGARRDRAARCSSHCLMRAPEVLCARLQSSRACELTPIVIMRPWQPCCSSWTVPLTADLAARQPPESPMQRLSVLIDKAQMNSKQSSFTSVGFPRPVWRTSCPDRWCCCPGPAAIRGACHSLRAALPPRWRAAKALPLSDCQRQQPVIGECLNAPHRHSCMFEADPCAL